MSRSTAQLDDIFDALANKHRRNIVHHLSLQPATISELADKQQLSLPAIHKHIRALEHAHLLIRKKNGRCNFLALDRTALLGLRDWIMQFNAHWGNNEETLENYIVELSRKSKQLTTT